MMEEVDDMKLTSCSFQNPELKFGYGIPKVAGISKLILSARLMAMKYGRRLLPGHNFNGTVKGRRVA